MKLTPDEREKTMNRRKSMINDLDHDIRDFIERETQDNIDRGMPPDEARYAALRKFGNATRVREDAREVWSFGWLEQLGRDIRFGLRMLARNPGFTAVALLTLALGIGANTAIFSLIDSVTLRMLPVERPDEILQVQILAPRMPDRGDPIFTNALWEQVRDRQDVFSGAFAWSNDKFDLSQGGLVHQASGLWVSGDFFNTLGLRPAAGRLLAPSDDLRGCPAVAVLSFDFWQDHGGGSAGAVGHALSLNGHPFEVVGVAPRGFFGMDVGQRFDVAVPVCAATVFDGKNSRLDHRSWWWLRIAGRIKPGVSPTRLRARLEVLSPRLFAGAVPEDFSPERQRNFASRTLVATPAATGTSELRQRFDQPLRVLMIVVGLVLLIACANIAGLMLARGAARQREIAVRQAIGASRARLIRQLLTEAFLLSSAGALLGILFARWGSALLVRYLSTARDRVFLDLSLDGRVLGFTLALAVLTSVLFGLLPALRSTRVSLASAMKGGQATEGGRRMRFAVRKWIVVGQVALSVVLLVAAGLLLRSFAKLATLDVGFDRTNVLLVDADLHIAKVPADRQLATFDEIEGRLGALPGVVSIGRSLYTPISHRGWNQDIETDWSKSLTGLDTLAWFNAVSPGFFKTLRMPVLAGRNFTSDDIETSAPVTIINQTLARRFFPNMNPIGKTFRMVGMEGRPAIAIEVVGLVKDAKYLSVQEDAPPTAYFPVTQNSQQRESESFELRTVIPPSALAAPIQAAVGGANREIPLQFHSLAEQVNDSLVQERLLALLSGFFGVVALLLAMVGLYGTQSYLVRQRQTEIGVRMALGAGRGSILGLVMRDVVFVLTGGVAVGVCLSLATTRLLQGMLFGLGAHDPITILAAAGLLSATALVAGYLPARRATKVDPMVALRYE
jgi:putative ABC transport system permease protein